ncbi:MAG: carbohydrate kinase family protein [Planctomycetia bacterium]|nr:carbohydrate kinase family protein [Planctomycetia bacterium]
MLDESLLAGTRLVVVGSICRDVKMAAVPPGDYLFDDGETSTDFIEETVGGGGANSALAAAALGAEVRFVGKLGADALGDRLEAALRRGGVRPFVRRDPATATGSSLVLRFTNGCRHFISAQPNNYSLAYDDVDPRALAGADHLLRADVWFSEPLLAGGNRRLLEAARAQGLATSLDLNWDPCWNSGDMGRIAERLEAVRQILPLVDLVHGNQRELGRFAGCDDLDATLRRLTDWGVRAVVLHRGAEGAGYYCRGELTRVPSRPVRQLKNTAGTGDLLSACVMLLDRHAEIPIAERLELANRIVAEFIEGRRQILPRLR